MDEKIQNEIERALELIRQSGNKFGEIILVVKSGDVKFVDFRCGASVLTTAADSRKNHVTSP